MKLITRLFISYGFGMRGKTDSGALVKKSAFFKNAEAITHELFLYPRAGILNLQLSTNLTYRENSL